MLTKKSLSLLSCKFSDMTYEKYLEKSYSIHSCVQDSTFDDHDDYILQIDFLSSGFTASKDLHKLNVDLDLVAQIKGAGKFFNIYNSTYITNNYTAGGEGFVFTKAIAGTTWIIANPLSFCPNVTVIDTDGQRISGQVVYSSNCTTITISFNSAVAGKAYLS